MTYVFWDTIDITGRYLRRYFRSGTYLILSTVQPITLVLLFAFVFGGAIATPPGVDYVDFLMPGIFVQTVVFNSSDTAVGLADDVRSGIVDRFRALPMSRSAVLNGRALSDSVHNLIAVLLMVVVGYLVGFRFHAGVPAALAAIAMSVLAGLCFVWIAAIFALYIRDAETANASTFIWLLPLTFASSAFVPVSSMPTWLQGFATYQPVSAFVDAVRALCLGGPTAGPMRLALIWAVALLVVTVPIAVRAYRRLP